MRIGESRLDRLKSISEIIHEEQLDNNDFDLSKVSASKVCNRSMQTSEKLYNNQESAEPQRGTIKEVQLFEDYPHIIVESKYEPHINEFSPGQKNVSPIYNKNKLEQSAEAKDFRRVDSVQFDNQRPLPTLYT